ncbi:MAG: hypothetical protein IJD95_02385 [Clostridia bacterium]|nr:hypothetical protein [Clostridia bacterium]
MINEYTKRMISDFVDGELPASECSKLFDGGEESQENNRYLHTLRFVKRAAGELTERAPEKLKSSTAAYITKTESMKKKSVVFNVMWITLTVLLVEILVWALWNPAMNDGGSTSSEITSSTVENSSADQPSSDVSSDISSGEASSDISSGEASSEPMDYSTYLPYGIDEYLKQSENYEDYRGMKFSFVIIAHGTKVNTLIDNRPGQFTNVVDEPRVWALITSKMTCSETETMFRTNEFTGIEVIEDERFDGIDKTAELGIVFVRAE